MTHYYRNGQLVEPKWYLPILPMILVNGSEGIGTGWRSYIPNYNPQEIVDNLKRLINNEETVKMHPWYRGFQ
ncbi:9902_t:CDS:2, partial [Funneliformis geosporum]